MGDAGVGEQAFEAGLKDRRKSTEENGDRPGNEQQGLDFDGNSGARHEKRIHEAGENDESSRLGANREESGDRRRRTLIHIWNPHVEWRGGDLETKAREDEGRSHEEYLRMDLGRTNGL